jgi:hypothetical protein
MGGKNKISQLQDAGRKAHHYAYAIIQKMSDYRSIR